MKKPVYVFIGPSGSGKSTFAADMKRRMGDTLEVISSDQIREEFLGDAADQSHQNWIWRELYYRLRDSLQNPLVSDIVVDATNVHAKDRRTLLKYIIEYDGAPHAVVFTTSKDECVARDSSRPRSVGNRVIERQFNAFSMSDILKEKWKHIYEMGVDGWKIVV